MVVELIGKYERIRNNSLTAFPSFCEICFKLALVFVKHITAAKNRIKSAVRLKSDCLAASARVPIADAIGVSRQAVSKARKGILPDLFKELFDEQIETIYKHVSCSKNWFGYRNNIGVRHH